jgi:hypothetical protein
VDVGFFENHVHGSSANRACQRALREISYIHVRAINPGY